MRWIERGEFNRADHFRIEKWNTPRQQKIVTDAVFPIRIVVPAHVGALLLPNLLESSLLPGGRHQFINGSFSSTSQRVASDRPHNHPISAVSGHAKISSSSSHQGIPVPEPSIPFSPLRHILLCGIVLNNEYIPQKSCCQCIL